METIDMIKLSHGNKKLVSNDKVQFLIFNLPAVTTCPQSTAMCRKACYALKAERLYPSAKASRERHLEASKRYDFIGAMITLIDAEYKKAVKKGKKILFRWHESGDIYSLDYMFSIIAIAKAFDDTDIIFQAYTKSIDFILCLGVPKNLHLTFSIWDDTPSEDIQHALQLRLQTYTAVLHFDRDLHKRFKCLCVDCAKCQKCYNNKVPHVICEVH